MISIAIIVKNGSQTLAKCLESIKDLSNDIVIVIDKNTTDNTVEIAKNFNSRIYSRDFDNFASQKNFAVSKTKYNWVFSLDADEYSSQNLNAEILNAVSNTKFVGFRIPRLNIIFSKAIHHTNWGPSDDTHVWLFNKKYCRWDGSVHEEVICNGKIGKLSNYKLHENYRTVEEFIDRMNLYTSREAKDGRMYSNPFFDFFRRYFWHLGFLDGWHGLFLSYLMIIYHLTIWVKKTCSPSLSS